MGVTARVIDQRGNPAAGVQAAICGTNVCGDITNSNASGDLSVNGGDLMFIAARFSLGYNGRGYTKLSSPITAAPTHDFGTLRVVTLPPFTTGADLVSGEIVTHGDVALGIPAGADIKFDCLAFADPADRRFVATVLDITDWSAVETPFLDGTLNLEAIVALGPLDTHICPAASLSFANVRSWTPGDEVEIYIHGTKTYQHYAPYGGWAQVADAVVSADGLTVFTVPGQGIEVLGTYGARLKP